MIHTGRVIDMSYDMLAKRNGELSCIMSDNLLYSILDNTPDILPDFIKKDINDGIIKYRNISYMLIDHIFDLVNGERFDDDVFGNNLVRLIANIISCSYEKSKYPKELVRAYIFNQFCLDKNANTSILKHKLLNKPDHAHYKVFANESENNNIPHNFIQRNGIDAVIISHGDKSKDGIMQIKPVKINGEYMTSIKDIVLDLYNDGLTKIYICCCNNEHCKVPEEIAKLKDIELWYPMYEVISEHDIL